MFSAETRLLLFTGFLGGFTTFSAFGVETVFLMRRGELWVALGYSLASLVCGMVLLWLGMVIVPHAK
jgi:CrcB protein